MRAEVESCLQVQGAVIEKGTNFPGQEERLPRLGIMSGSFKNQKGASPVAQWLRICLPMQGTRVRALVREDPTCHGATKPVSHNY